ncbi:Cd(II)/Pb(II)-responsive transcriptional regulator [Alteromonas pelagimontana]|uniref:Cd(II)/Pb(II)-responsive transcriptional regulator n=1 Tax=Alteromonas pelagimontana TaxID=1858656 RepID=A0A6M4MB05_9ALTE|nr:Cd(II)/Pb(II)-responsive transcriptional regulator [Alteromonas pelagimontana]QJR80352.1 Cd(II)/Pb(II)-responsive transcriptional regulator [Alteromonas pelagimontana]
MKIGELTTATKVPAKTIRYYEKISLLPPPYRAANGYRHYRAKDAETLVFIRRCRELNIAIDDIKRLLDVQQNPNASCTEVDNIIADQLARVQQTQRELAMLEASLVKLASSCTHHQIQDCTILQELKSCAG